MPLSEYHRLKELSSIEEEINYFPVNLQKFVRILPLQPNREQLNSSVLHSTPNTILSLSQYPIDPVLVNPLLPYTTPAQAFLRSQVYNRRVVDVSDHKTCALLMTRMKEMNRQPSPNHKKEMLLLAILEHKELETGTAASGCCVCVIV
uniref:STAR_dimer domain-containing protein n=1 Tax=Heterorhabditis bacteriophora TaxID=37862 RepID=A0A1I7WZZ5_HETBA